MRYYCVDPSLPLQAKLRIRAAPDRSAPVRGRIYQGRAIATCSPVLQDRGNDDDATSTSWLQVAYLDTASGKMEEGFVMAALPDGISLLTPWEKTGYRGCCQVVDPVTPMFNGPQDAAQSLGVLQGVASLYCMMKESETRVRIFHPKLESVWVDKEDVQVVCTRLEHEECNTPHAFYEMNDELPEEAQIAVREFPSQEAQVVGLLNRDETLEVTMRSGNWLQIVGGSLDKTWIMFQTDVLKLLHEARDVCSSNCQRIQGDADNFVDVESTTSQAFSAKMHTLSLPSNQMAGSRTASTLMLEVNHELDTVLKEDDAGEMGNEHAAVTLDGLPDMAVHLDTAKHSQAWEECPLRPAQQAIVDDDNASNAAAKRADVIDDVGGTSATESAIDTYAEVAELAFAVQASGGRPVRSAWFTYGEADADAAHDLAAADVGIYSNGTNMEDGQIGHSGYTRAIRPAQAGDDDCAIVDEEDTASCKKYNVQETKIGKLAQTLSTQGDQSTRPFRNAPDPNDAVTEAVANAGHEKAEMIVTDANDSNAVGAILDDLSWDDRPTGPARKLVTGNSCSAGIGNFAVSETRDVVSEHGLLSWDDLHQITERLNDEIGDKGDATIVVSAHIMVSDITPESTKPIQSIKSCNSPPIRHAPLEFGGAQECNEDIITGNGAVNFVTVASYVDECADGKEFEKWGDRTNVPSRAHPNEVGVNGSTTVHVGEGGLATRSRVKDSYEQNLEPEHVKQPGNDRRGRPAQIFSDKIVDSGAGDTSADVAELAVVDTAGSSKARVDIGVANLKREAAKLLQFAQSCGNRPARSTSTIPNEADNESDDAGCDILRIRSAYEVDGTGALIVGKNENRNVKGPEQPWDQQAQTTLDAPTNSDVTREQIGTGIADVYITGKSFENDDVKKIVQVRNDCSSNPALKGWVNAGGHNNAAVSANLLAAVKNLGDSAIADGAYLLNVRSIVMDEVQKVTRVQIANSQNNPLALGSSSRLLPNADNETMHDRPNFKPTARLSVVERRYAESETTSGSENGEIALLGDLEDVFEPVDEWLSATQEKDHEGFGDGSLGALPVAIRTETSSSRGTVINGEQGKQPDSSRNFHGAFCSAEEKVQDGVAVQSAGISFLKVVGIRKYCAYKQNLVTPADELSIAMYKANQDDSDLVFQALVGDDPLSDDWFYDVSLRHFQAYKHSSIRNIDLLSAGPRLTFDLIMSDASPEDILAAGLTDDECADFDLVISFKYPVPIRKVVGPSRPPLPVGRLPGLETKTTSATNKSGVEAGAPSASRQPKLPSGRTSTKASEGEFAINAVTSSETALSRHCIGQPKTPPPSSRLRRKSITTPLSISNPPSSLVQPRSLMQPLRGAPMSSSNSAFSGLAPPFEASVSLISTTSTFSELPSTRSFFQRRGFVSTPSNSRAFSESGLARNSIAGSPKLKEVSGLSVPLKSFGFRHPSGVIKKT